MHQTVEKILLDFNPEVKNLLPALKKISAVFEFVSEKEAQITAEYFSIPLSKVFETASFYDLVQVKKNPPLVIQVCSSANCASGGSLEIIREIERALGIRAGDEFSPKLKLETISCLGRCEEGPVLIINDKIFTQVSKSGVHAILKEYL